MTKDNFIKILFKNGWVDEFDDLEEIEEGDSITFLYKHKYAIVFDNMENPDDIHICDQEGNNFIGFSDFDAIYGYLIEQNIIK